MPVRSTSIPHKVYKFVSHNDVSITTNLLGRSFGNEWLDIHTDGKITVKGTPRSGYAWDGCSPKGDFLDITWGTPDGKFDFSTEQPLTYFASMIHDALYQFKADVPVSRKEADVLFLLILREARFVLAGLYGLAVRTFGGLYGSWACSGSQEAIAVTSFSWRHPLLELNGPADDSDNATAA